LIAEDSFRADLYYRISPFEIILPSLREREQDIPILVKRILARLSQQLHRNINVSPEALRLFLKYSWPGNLRELDTVICRAAGQVGILENIRPEHLPANIQKPVRLVKANQAFTEARSLDEVEENVLMEAASLCRGNISEMARVLGVGRTTVWRKLKVYGIPIQEYRQNSIQTEES
jgi:transcriptional activator for dhaKLM operon